MPLTLEELEKEALQLGEDDRAALAHRLLSSLGTEPDDPASQEEIERLWMAEAERRYRDIARGAVQTKSSEQVFSDVRARLNEGR